MMIRFVFLLLSLSLSSCIIHNETSPEIKGVIIDRQDKQTLGGASVELNDQSSMITEDDGRFYFAPKSGWRIILPASHRVVPKKIVIQKPSYHPVIITGYSENRSSPVKLTRNTAEQGAAANP